MLSTAGNCNLSHHNTGIWVIAEGRFSDIDLSGVIDEKVDGPYKEYIISDIGRYLLNPHSIEVKKKLIGGEIHYKQGTIKKSGNFFMKSCRPFCENENKTRRCRRR